MRGIIKRFLDRIHTLAVLCTQWGDTGKGKFIDYLADWADVIARGQGGANAGHTVCVNGREYVCHLLPSGMLHAKLNVIGSGVAVEPRTLLGEITTLAKAGISADKLRVSSNARLVLPQHVLLDRVREAAQGAGKIGTTGRGIGPCYRDHVDRVGLVLNDLLNPDVFVRKLRRNLEEKIRLLRTYDPELVQAVLRQEMLENGTFSHPTEILDIDAIASRYLSYGQELQSFLTDTDGLLRSLVGRKRILLEGAQGVMLSVDHGTYPYVTSSDCTLSGLAKGVGLPEGAVDIVFGIAKAFYMTRVGEGPFPTEIGGEASANHSRGATRESEQASHPEASINDPDELVQSIAIRRVGDEFGATTGRARRVGWFDLPLLRYAAQFTGPNIVLTKLDVLDGAETVKICHEYKYTGPDYNYGGHILQAGHRLRVAVPDPEVMKHCDPCYTELPGWVGPIRGIRKFEKLPENLQRAVCFVHDKTNLRVVLLSVGADRDETIFVNPPLQK